MTTDDSRDTKPPDRRNESTTNARPSIETRLEHLDVLTRTLLADLEHPTRSPRVDETDRRTVRRHLLQIRAEASQAGLRLVGPEATMPYRPGTDRDGLRRTGAVSSTGGSLSGRLECHGSSE
ncbi:hypothetical protein [Natrialba sp. INN-245]|uniref:hypothetical protein n=1 Tax=Natrialba sp. INN-245 TaxID=2690967 RepID=UPI00190F415A|nr:hypothetical protein [Natrialba sp. INN-245]